MVYFIYYGRWYRKPKYDILFEQLITYNIPRIKKRTRAISKQRSLDHVIYFRWPEELQILRPLKLSRLPWAALGSSESTFRCLNESTPLLRVFNPLEPLSKFNRAVGTS